MKLKDLIIKKMKGKNSKVFQILPNELKKADDFKDVLKRLIDKAKIKEKGEVYTMPNRKFGDGMMFYGYDKNIRLYYNNKIGSTKTISLNIREL